MNLYLDNQTNNNSELLWSLWVQRGAIVGLVAELVFPNSPAEVVALGFGGIAAIGAGIKVVHKN